MFPVIEKIQQNRKAKISLISVASIAVFLVLLPFMVQWGMQYALKQQGAKQVAIADIDLNLFTGQFAIEQLEVVFDKEPLVIKTVYVDLAMLPLLQSKIILNSIIIDGVALKIERDESGDMRINGFKLATKAEEKTTDNKASVPIGFAIKHFVLSQSSVAYSEPGFQQNVHIKSIRIDDVRSWESDSITKIDVQLSEQKTKFNAELEAQLFAKAKTLKGSIALSKLQKQRFSKFTKQYVDQLKGTIDVDIVLDLAYEEILSGSVEHTIKISNLKAVYKQLQLVTEQLSSKGKTQLAQNEVTTDSSLTITGSTLLDLETNQLINAFKQLDIKGAHFEKGEMTLNELALNGLDVLASKDKITLMHLGSLKIKDIHYSLIDSQLHINNVELQNPNFDVTLTKEKKVTHLVQLNQLLERFKAPNNNEKQQDKAELSGSAHFNDNLSTTVGKAELSGSAHFNDNLSTTVGKPGREAKPIVINVDTVVLTKPGKLKFTDLGVQPNYTTDLHFNQINIEQLSTENPADFTLALKQGEYTSIDIKGTGLLFNPQKSIDYVVKIKQLDLPPVSSYSSQMMGYGIKSGVVDSVIKGSIKQNKISTNVTLKIDSIEVTETDKETAQQISSASGMSIDLALSTLKDSDNIIDLELPIGGDVKKPDFDLSLIINKAMGAAMKFASLSYLKHALQPFSGLFSLVSMAAEAANSMSLAPVEFESNNATLRQKQKQLLDKVANVLTERPGIKVKACGVAALSDKVIFEKNYIKAEKAKQLKAELVKQKQGKREQGKREQGKREQGKEKIKVKVIEIPSALIKQQMKTLADARAAAVKAYLIKVKKINASKVLNCLSVENLKKDSQPVVDLVI